MSFLKSATLVLLTAAAGLLTSCIDGREEVWLEANGSGRAEITYSLPAAAARLHGGDAGIRKLIARFLEDTPEIHSSSSEVLTENGRTRVKVSASFASALDLKEVAEGRSIDRLPTAASYFAGQVKTEIRGRSVEFARTITPSKALPGSAFMPASQFEGRRLEYIMHLPVAVTESNATRVENSGRTLVWDVPLNQALKSPIVTRFKLDIPVPWTLVTAIALPLSLVGGLVFRQIRKSRRNPVAAVG
jgi:hypothetical protein